MEHRNDAVTIYCLALIAEEGAEAAGAAGQALRFGLDTPSDPYVGYPTAKSLMEQEVGDLLAAANFAARHGVIDMSEVLNHADRKLAALLNTSARDNLDRPLAPAPSPKAHAG